MKPTTASLAEILHRTARAEEQPPLLSRGEILEILREAEGKKAAPLLLPSKPALLPRILKISAAGLSAAAVITLFIWKTGTDEPVKTPATTYSGEGKSQESTSTPVHTLPQIAVTTKQPESRQSSANQQLTLADAQIPAQQHTQSATASGRASAPQAMMAIEDNSIAESAETAANEMHVPAENTSKTAAIETPDSIEPVISKRLNDTETALGITFETPVASASTRSADSPASNSFSRSFVPETNSLMPKPSSLMDSKRKSVPPAVKSKNPEKSLLEILLDATANPKAVTLIQDGKILANEWNFGTSADARADDLLPVHVSLRGKEIAEGKADYALLWLPPSASKPAQTSSFVLTITQNPVEGNRARMILVVPAEVIFSIAIYDIFGGKIQEVVLSEKAGKGQFSREFDTENLADGFYTLLAVGEGGKELASCRFAVEKIRGR